MPIYNYKALTGNGAPQIGVIDADTPKEARTKLHARKLHVTELVTVDKTGAAATVPSIPLPFFRRRKIQELAMVTRQLATLLNSGIPLMGTLTAIIDQVEDRTLKATFMSVREKVAQGSTLADALEANTFYFNELYVNMVRAGEASGNLDAVLFRLADYLQTQSRIRAKVLAALTYPIIMVIVGTGVIIYLMTFVVPKIVEVIQKHSKVLPLPTEILLAVSGFMQKTWWLFLILAIVAYFVYKAIRRTEKGRLAIDSFALRIPLLGPLFKKSAISRFAVTFAVLLESGLPVLEALNVVKRVVNNQLLSKTLDEVRQKVTEGADIATPLKNSKIFPPVVGYMIAVGEESGRLEELLRKISQAYDEEVEIASQKLTSLLEPLMIIVMAAVVGFIVLAILLPVWTASKL